jgi:GTPase Era involved in 16S rRNA processing
LNVIIVGTTHVGKSELFNQLLQAPISPTSPNVDTTDRVYNANFLLNSISVRIYDFPGTHGLKDICVETVIETIKKIIWKRNYSFPTIPIQKLNLAVPKLISEAIIIKTTNTVFLFVVDLINGFKRADSLLLSNIRHTFPRTRLFIICQKANLMHQSDVERALNKLKEKVADLKSFVVIGGKNNNSKYREIWESIFEN